MKLYFKSIALAFAAAMLFQACTDKPVDEPQPGTLTVNFVVTANNQPFQLGQPYTSAKGLNYKFDIFKFYLSNLTLYGPGQPDTVLDAALINYSNTVPYKSFTIDVQPGTYTGFRFGIGLDSIQNKFDPTQFPSSSPFSASAGTHWGMFFMYRFMLIEGAVDTTDDNTANYVHPIVMHTGFDSLYTTKEFQSFPFEIQDGKNTTINLNLDFNRLFYLGGDTIDLINNNITHTNDNYPLAAKVTRNLANAIQASN